MVLVVIRTEPLPEVLLPALWVLLKPLFQESAEFACLRVGGSIQEGKHGFGVVGMPDVMALRIVK